MQQLPRSYLEEYFKKNGKWISSTATNMEIQTSELLGRRTYRPYYNFICLKCRVITQELEEKSKFEIVR